MKQKKRIVRKLESYLLAFVMVFAYVVNSYSAADTSNKKMLNDDVISGSSIEITDSSTSGAAIRTFEEEESSSITDEEVFSKWKKILFAWNGNNAVSVSGSTNTYMPADSYNLTINSDTIELLTLKIRVELETVDDVGYSLEAGDIKLSFEVIAKGEDADNEYTLILKTVSPKTTNPLKLWHDLGEPATPNTEQTKLIKSAAFPQVTSDRLTASEGSISFDQTLDPETVVYFELSKSKVKSDRGYSYERTITTR